ncbi:cytochrome c oxidase assembly protein [Paracoccus sp. S-4012]|nr:cytochrome c oxidase assembly protein [Paracoccus sp. S-4012]MRX50670.1 cytochrome c oxidase assembly protein [Paracoccus sp. S-4012]
MTVWNLDPVLLAGLGVLAWACHARATRPGAAWAGFALAVLVFVSPLCNLTSALFSARVLHHVLLTAAIAPLLVRGFGLERFAIGGGLAAAGVHAVLMWLWHMPGAYAWGLGSVPGYWLMQATLLLSALWLWSVILGRAGGAALGAAAASFIQMGMLGAVIVFASVPLYGAHLLTTAPWGLTALEDQQLAGLLMWVPAAGPYMAAILWQVMVLLREDEPAAGHA